MVALEASALVTSITGALTTVGSDCLGVATAVLPIAIPVMAVGVVVGVGIKIFKKVAGK